MVGRIKDFDEENEKKFCERHPMGRCAEPEEIAEAVLWLCGDKFRFITGPNLLLDRGSMLQR